MPTSKTTPLKRLNAFIQQNPQLNLQQVDLGTLSDQEGVNWSKLLKHKDEVIAQLTIFRRLRRIVPTDEPNATVLALMEQGLESATQIAGIPRRQFIQTYSPLFNGDAGRTETVYLNARNVRSQLLARFVQKR